MAGETPQPSDVIDFARKAEEIGLDSVWLTDHLYHEPYLDFLDHGYQLPVAYAGIRQGYWECWTLLAAVAANTDKVEIGTLVTNAAFRNPTLLANMAETLDALSDGRLVLGVGAGDFRSEHTFLGAPWEQRIGRFEEALQIVTSMLRGDRVTFDGDFYQAQDAGLLPRGPRETGPPVVIGMMRCGPRMSRLAAQYGDGWSCWLAFEDSHAENFENRLERVNETAGRHGRDPETLARNVTVCLKAPGVDNMVPGANPITGPATDVALEINKYRALGVDHLSVFLQPYHEDGITWLEAVLNEVRQVA